MRPDVAAWFVRRTSRAADWPTPLLRAAKGTNSVSVVLPALDEERTIGAIVRTIVTELCAGPVPLVDEVLVVDSGSTDATVALALAAGARVVHRSDVLTDIPVLPGKGEVLWRGLAASTGDVVVYVDSDLQDFTADFVTGLLGPLLTDPSVQLVKATYDRALRAGETLLPAGGGRVTELVARPLLNLGWPELAGFVQPLSGEYAARRTLLETLRFPTGYGVEIGLLVDALHAVGLDALAQVDLVRRKHRNSDDAKLGQMASEIMQVVLARLASRVSLAEPVSTELTQFARDGTGYRISTSDMTPHERPPLLDVASYTAARARRSSPAH